MVRGATISALNFCEALSIRKSSAQSVLSVFIVLPVTKICPLRRRIKNVVGTSKQYFFPSDVGSMAIPVARFLPSRVPVKPNSAACVRVVTTLMPGDHLLLGQGDSREVFPVAVKAY